MAKILLVEDDNNLREIYEARLQAEGYDIVSAKDGEEALVIAKKEQPDLIIADVMMPRVSGFEMLDILRNTPELRDVHVIMLTALGQAEDKTRADSLGADRYLVKSQVTLEDIVKSASDVLAGAPAGAAAAAAAADSANAQAAQQAAPPNATTPPSDSTTPAINIPVAAPPAEPAQTATPAPAEPTAPTQDATVPPAQPAPTIPVATPPADVATQQPAGPAPAVEPMAATPAPTQNSTQAHAPDPSANDAQLVTDAVKNLVAGTGTAAASQDTSNNTSVSPSLEPPAQPIAVTPAPQPQQPTATPAVPAAPTEQPVASAPAPAPAAPAPTDQDVPTPAADAINDVTPAGRKTIQPLAPSANQQPAGLDELLAKEGVHAFDESAHPAQPPYSGPPHPPGHIISPGNANPGAPGDPNSISL